MGLDFRKASKILGARALFATLLTLVLSITGFAQTFDKAKLNQFFDRLASKNQAMGSLAIVKDGKVLYSRVIGYSQINGTEKKPLTAANKFRIASIGKMYTAVMIMQLVEEQKLKLTDTLDRFFPQVPNANKITILQMLSHRSGIPNVQRDWDPQRNWRNGITKNEMFDLITKATPEFAPDTKQSYSNSGYFLLTLILEKITGKSYAEALEERITSKIGLADTYIEPEFINVNKNESLTYIHFGGDWRQVHETHPSIAYGAGQIMSTPNDLAKFIQALFDGKILSAESLNQMKTIRDGEGLGIVTFTFAGKVFYGNTGGGDNYGSWLAYEPEEKLAVAYTTNAKVYPVENIVRGAVEIYYHKPFHIPTFETVAVSPDVLDLYVGVYSNSEGPVRFRVTRKGTRLFVQAGNETAVAIEATAENKFQLAGGRIVFEFDAAKGQMILKRGVGERVFTKDK
jgi:CubicO group peptidase (beta-lactamase class C family)